MKLFLICCAVIISGISSLFGGYMNYGVAEAEENSIEVTTFNSVEVASVKPYGIYTNISIQLSADSEYVWATAKNEFTLFPATIPARVRLYSSTYYTEDFSLMTLEAESSTSDLNMGESLIAKSYFKGRKFYWKAEVYYQMDATAPKTLTTQVYYIDENGATMA